MSSLERRRALRELRRVVIRSIQRIPNQYWYVWSGLLALVLSLLCLTNLQLRTILLGSSLTLTQQLALTACYAWMNWSALSLAVVDCIKRPSETELLWRALLINHLTISSGVTFLITLPCLLWTIPAGVMLGEVVVIVIVSVVLAGLSTPVPGRPDQSVATWLNARVNVDVRRAPQLAEAVELESDIEPSHNQTETDDRFEKDQPESAEVALDDLPQDTEEIERTFGVGTSQSAEIHMDSRPLDLQEEFGALRRDAMTLRKMSQAAQLIRGRLQAIGVKTNQPQNHDDQGLVKLDHEIVEAITEFSLLRRTDIELRNFSIWFDSYLRCIKFRKGEPISVLQSRDQVRRDIRAAQQQFKELIRAVAVCQQIVGDNRRDDGSVRLSGKNWQMLRMCLRLQRAA